MPKLKPYYPYKAIGSVDALARTLDVHPQLIKDMARRAPKSYTSFEIYSAKGKARDVVEPKPILKAIQKRINSRVFEKVEYPYYLQGGLKDPFDRRDYVINAGLHCPAATLINLDIENFYPSIRADQVFEIYKYLFRFPDEVSRLLVSLTTLNNALPQGACTSSYIANLVFFNDEYRLVSNLLSNKLRYTRLLDDITISSPTPLDKRIVNFCVRSVANICTKYGFRLNEYKKRIEYSGDPTASFSVTGLWVGHGVPKERRRERRYVRQLVYACEKAYLNNPYSEEYHKLWNKVSGKVSKLSRLGHVQAKDLRKRLARILPLYDEWEQQKVRREVQMLCTPKMKRRISKIGHLQRVNKAFYSLGVLSRTNKALSRSLRKQLQSAYATKPTIAKFWEAS